MVDSPSLRPRQWTLLERFAAIDRRLDHNPGSGPITVTLLNEGALIVKPGVADAQINRTDLIALERAGVLDVASHTKSLIRFRVSQQGFDSLEERAGPVETSELEARDSQGRPGEDHDERAIREYVLLESPRGERVKSAEKIATQRAFGERWDVWDVYTKNDRWWVITNPTNLYRQADFEHMDMAFTFHLGLRQRLAMRNEPRVEDEERERLAGAFRRWTQAAEALEAAEEAEDFQAVGMRCREALISFAQDVAKPEMVPAGEEQPKASDFVHWAERIADWAAPGSRGDRVRGHLKAVSKSTWELAGWLTHAKSATRLDGILAVEATQHALGQFATAILRKESGEPERCPQCSSYRMTSDYRPEVGTESGYVERCDACGWEDLPDDEAPVAPRNKAAMQLLPGGLGPPEPPDD
jgi:hypothetical protein